MRRVAVSMSVMREMPSKACREGLQGSLLTAMVRKGIEKKISRQVRAGQPRRSYLPNECVCGMTFGSVCERRVRRLMRASMEGMELTLSRWLFRQVT